MSQQPATPKHEMKVSTEDRSAIFERIIRAPRELVYRAFLDPVMLKQWFSPKTFHTPHAETDPRVGGAFRIVMAGADGEQYPMKGFYEEIVPNERIAFSEDLSEHSDEWKALIQAAAGEGEDILHTKATVTFEDHPEGTLVNVRSDFSTNAVRDAYTSTGAEGGWSQLFDKLDVLVATNND